MNKLALIVAAVGVVLLVTMSSMYFLIQNDASLEMEKGEEFTGLDPYWVNWQRGFPAKVGDSVYLLLDDQEIVDQNVTHNYTVGRLDLRSGNLENRSLAGMENLDDNTIIYSLLQGEGEIYLIGYQGISDEDPSSNRVVIYELDLETMELGEGWAIPELDNANMVDLLIDDGALYKMPGYFIEFDGNDTELIPVPTIVAWDLESHEMVENLTVPEYLCDAVLLPFNGKYFVYWVGNEYLSDSFVYDAEEQEDEPLVSLGDYDNYRMYEKSASVCGNAIVIPYLREYVDFQWKLSNSTFALDDSFEPVKGQMDISDVGEAYWLMSCSDDDEVVTLQYWLSNSSTELSLNIATYYTTFDEGGPPFPSWPLAVPVAVIVLGLLLFLKKN
ncbi:MAG TPA: hypothetical protein HA343_03045 [Methanomassiliicoccales archaeon]|nr:hypothetical protein [Methanomassiliicoccales archaeon]